MREEEAIATVDKFTDYIQKIQSVKVVSFALNYLGQIDVLKRALEVADTFRENSVKFAMLEATALLKIIELGGDSEIKPRNRRLAARWLFDVPVEERQKYIEMCLDGKTIENVYRDIVLKPEREAKTKVTAKVYEEAVLDAFNFAGMVCLNDYQEKLDKLPIDENVKDSIRHSMRTKLIKAGALGIGDGDGTYVSADNKEMLARAIEVRIASIESDIIKLANIVKTANCDKPEVFIGTRNNQTTDAPIRDYIMVMLAAAGIVKCTPRTTSQANRIADGIISATFPDYYRSSALFESVYKAVDINGDNLTDKFGSVSDYINLGPLNKRKANDRAAAETIGRLYQA